MALDFLAFQRIVELIKPLLVNGKIYKINQVSNEEFLFLIRNNGKNFSFLICTHPNMSYMNIVEEKIESTHCTSNLLMLLRKYLENGKVVDFIQENNDRVAKLVVSNKDEYYNNTNYFLIIELIGRASNIILTNQDSIIIDCLKKIPLEYLNIRTIQANVKYQLPPFVSEETLPYELLNEIETLKINKEELCRRISQSNQIYITKANQKSFFHFIPLTYLNGDTTSYIWNQGIDAFYHQTISEERHRQFTSQMCKLAKNEIKRSEKKVKKLEEELQVAKEAIIYKEYGDLLLTYMQGVKITENKVTIFDEVNEKNVTIDYDLRYDLYHNANLYYKKYQKSKVAIVKITEQINICNENIEYFTGILYHLNYADYESALQIKEELNELGYFRKYQNNNKNKKKSKKKEKVYKPMMFKIHDTIIYAGMNNLQNEYLTFKMANKMHYFFHIQQGPGSHVVVFSDKLNDEIKKIAANIAAYYSSYRQSSTVGVNYTLVKNIKKIPGGKPGKVIINNQKTIYVDPDLNVFKDFIV